MHVLRFYTEYVHQKTCAYNQVFTVFCLLFLFFFNFVLELKKINQINHLNSSLLVELHSSSHFTDGNIELFKF